MKRLSVFLIALVVVGHSFAQTDTVYNSAGKADSDWFLSLMVGGDVLFNQSRQQNSDIYATNGIRPEVSLTAGKWIMPYFGFQVGLKSFWWQGAASSADLATWNFDLTQITPLADGSSNFNVFYINPHIDAMLSLSSCINKGYVQTCKWDVVPFVGIGYMYGFGAQGVPVQHSLTGHFGLMGKYRITDYWDINLAVATTIMAEGYTTHAGAVAQEICRFRSDFRTTSADIVLRTNNVGRTTTKHLHRPATTHELTPYMCTTTPSASSNAVHRLPPPICRLPPHKEHSTNHSKLRSSNLHSGRPIRNKTTPHNTTTWQPLSTPIPRSYCAWMPTATKTRERPK